MNIITHGNTIENKFNGIPSNAMFYSILDYNKTLNSYNKKPSAVTYNNALNSANRLQSYSSQPARPSGGGQQQAAPQGGGGGGTSSGGGGGGGEPDYSQQISDMYEPALEATRSAERFANEEYGTDTKSLDAQFANQATKNTQNEQELLGNTQTEENKFNQVLQSAYADAVRSYNALQQQGNARFGRGSSAGAAVGELAQQEYFRQQGQVQNKQVEGSQQFTSERLRIKQYVKSKADDLEVYKQQAMGDLKKNLNDKLLEIQMRRGDIESNKTRDRLAILQDALNQTRAIQSADRQFRQNLTVSALSKMQEVSGRAFTPKEIQATLQEFEGALSGQNIGAAAVAQGTQTSVAKKNGRDDEFGGLLNYA